MLYTSPNVDEFGVAMAVLSKIFGMLLLAQNIESTPPRCKCADAHQNYDSSIRDFKRQLYLFYDLRGWKD